MNSEKVSRKEVLPGFIAIITLAVIVYIAMELSAEKIADNQFIYSFGDLIGRNIEGGPMGGFLWFLTDLTEGCFTVSVLGTVFMCIVVPFTAILEKKKSPMAGTGVDGNGRNFSAMFIAAFVSILLSQIIYGRGEWFEKYGFIPTFSALLVSQTMITCYGKSLKKVITSIIIGAVVPFPICFILMAYVTIPLGLPGFISVSLGLIITIPIVHKIVMLLPWMKEKENIPEAVSETDDVSAPYKPNSFFIHRVFGDVGELVIWGSSWSIIAMYIGSIITWILNPNHPVYGANNLSTLIFCQICTGALSVFIYYPSWKKDGWAFTFPGIVFISAIVNTYINSWLVIIPSMLIGAIVFPPLVQRILKVFKYDGSYPAIGLIQLSISLICIPWSLIVLHIITPML